MLRPVSNQDRWPLYQEIAKNSRGVSPRIKESILVMPRNSTKPKLKLKTHRGAKKRFKITANGKIKRMHSGKRHLMGTKAPGRMRKLKKLTLVSPRDVAAVRQMLPYG
jgi:large subunit ribosomal protein L35